VLNNNKKIPYISLLLSKTIARDLLIWLVFLIALVGIIAEVGFYFYADKVAHREMNQSADVLIEELASMLTIPLYNIDVESVRHVSKTYSMIPNIEGIRIVNEQNIVLFNTIEQNSGLLARHMDIYRDGLFLGKANLILDESYYHRSHRQTLIALFVMGVLIVGCMVIGIHIIMHYILFRPLQKFNQGLLEIAYGNYATRLNAVSHIDLNASVNSVNSMAERIEVVVGELSVTRDFLQNVLNSMPSVMIGVDQKRCITNLNRAALRSTEKKYHNCLGKSVEEIFPNLDKDFSEKIQQSMARQEVIIIEHQNCSLLGGKKCAEITIYPLHGSISEGAVIRVDDITSRIRLQEVMVRTEKMLSVGGLGAGMAHEINNPLGGILQAAQNLERRLSPNLAKNVEVAKAHGIEFSAMEAYLRERQIFTMLTGIQEAGQRAAQIVQNMLQFSRRSDSSMENCILAEILDRVLELANNDYDLKRKYDFRHFKIIRNYRHDIHLTCSKTEVEQVFLNLFKNAAQAYGPNDGHDDCSPEITINAYQDDEFVTIEVVDNGKGMDEETRKRIFEPFFTTKGVGEGTGLGLAVSYFIIVDQHNGHLKVDSTPEEGTTFTVQFPLS